MAKKKLGGGGLTVDDQRSLYDETFAIDESPTTFLGIVLTRNGIEC